MGLKNDVLVVADENHQLSVSQQAPLRERRLRLAIGYSLASKIANAALQILSLPVAAVALGNHGFSLYVLMIAAVGWLSLLNLGLGAPLVKRISIASAVGRREDLRALLDSALIPNLLVSNLIAVIFLAIVWTGPVELLLGRQYVSDLIQARIGLTVLAIFFIIQSNIGIFESVQVALQEQHFTNLSAAIGAGVAFFAVLLVAKYSPSPVLLLCAVFFPPLVLRAANAVLLLMRHPGVAPGFNSFRFSVTRSLLGEGLIFSLAGGAGNFLAHVFPIFMIGRTGNSLETANFAAVMNSIIISAGLLGMITTPLWGALADSHARKDLSWIIRAYRKLQIFGIGIGLLVATAYAFIGEWIFSVWYRGVISPDHLLLTMAGLYFLLLCWENVHWTMLVGMGEIKRATLIYFMRGAVGAAVIALGVVEMGARNQGGVIFLILAVSCLVVSAVPLWHQTKIRIADL